MAKNTRVVAIYICGSNSPEVCRRNRKWTVTMDQTFHTPLARFELDDASRSTELSQSHATTLLRGFYYCTSIADTEYAGRLKQFLLKVRCIIYILFKNRLHDIFWCLSKSRCLETLDIMNTDDILWFTTRANKIN